MLGDEAAPVLLEDDGATAVLDDEAAHVEVEDDGATAVLDVDAAPAVVEDDGATAVLDNDAAPVVVEDDEAPALADVAKMDSSSNICAMRTSSLAPRPRARAMSRRCFFSSTLRLLRTSPRRRLAACCCSLRSCKIPWYSEEVAKRLGGILEGCGESQRKLA